LYEDIHSISAIPNYFLNWDWREEDEYEYYLEVKSQNGERMILKNEVDEFMCHFEKSHAQIIKKFPSAPEINKQFGKSRVILSSFLFEDSPLKIPLWKMDN
jgi:hypothetical protein